MITECCQLTLNKRKFFIQVSFRLLTPQSHLTPSSPSHLREVEKVIFSKIFSKLCSMHEYQILQSVQIFVILSSSRFFTLLADKENKIFKEKKKRKKENLKTILFYTCVPNIIITGCMSGQYGYRCKKFY